MHLWIVFSLLATLIWASQNLIDKIMLASWNIEPKIFLVVGSILGLLSAIVTLLLTGFPIISLPDMLLAILSGGSALVSFYLYLKAVQIEDISVVVALFYLTPIFTAILSGIFLSEVFGTITYVGIGFLSCGAILVSSKKLREPHLGRPLALMLAATLAAAVSGVTVKGLLSSVDFWTAFSYVRIGEFIVALPIIYKGVQIIPKTFRNQGMRIGGVVFQEALTILALLLLTIATSEGFVTLVNAVTSFQALFVLSFAIFLSKIRFDLKEELGGRLILKVFGIGLMLIGTFLMLSFLS